MARAVAESKVVILAENRAAKAFDQAGKQADGLQKRLTGVSIAAAGVTTAAIAAATALAVLTVGAANNAAELEAQAAMAGVTVEALQELTFAAGEYKITQEALTDGLKELALRADEFAVTGKGTATEAFQRLGFSADEVNGLLSDTPEFLNEVIGRLEDLDKAAQIRIADEIFGGQGGEQFQQLIRGGAVALGELRQEARDLGIVMDTALVTQSAEANRQLERMEKIVGVSFQRVLLSFTPIIETLAISFAQLAPAIARTVDQLVIFFGGIELVGIEALNRELATLQEQLATFEEQNTGGRGGPRRTTEIAETREAIAAVEDLIAVREREAAANRQLFETQGPRLGSGPTEEEVVKAEAGFARIHEAFLRSTEQDAELIDFRLQRQLEALDSLALSEEQRRIARFELESVALLELSELRRTDQEQIELDAQEHADRLNQTTARAAANNAALWKSGLQGQLQVTSSFLGQIATLQDSESKKAFKIGKAAAIAKATIDTYQAAIGAYSAMASIPYVGPALGAAAAAAALAFGFTQVKRIASQKFGGGSSSAGGGGGGGFSAPSAGGAPVASVPTLPPQVGQQQPQQINLNLVSDSGVVSTAWVADVLIPEINNAIGDGVQLTAAA